MISDDKQTIDEASIKSGARKMLTDLAQKMRNQTDTHKPEQHKGIDQFLVKTEQEIPGMTLKIVETLDEYAKKVAGYHKYYSTADNAWVEFEFRDREMQDEIASTARLSLRLMDTYQTKTVNDFNLMVTVVLKHFLLGGIS